MHSYVCVVKSCLGLWQAAQWRVRVPLYSAHCVEADDVQAPGYSRDEGADLLSRF